MKYCICDYNDLAIISTKPISFIYSDNSFIVGETTIQDVPVRVFFVFNSILFFVDLSLQTHYHRCQLKEISSSKLVFGLCPRHCKVNTCKACWLVSWGEFGSIFGHFPVFECRFSEGKPMQVPPEEPSLPQEMGCLKE